MVWHKHLYKSTLYFPTCLVQGYTEHICSVCNDTYRDSYTALAPHDYQITLNKEPSCLDNGLTSYACTVCGNSYIVDIAPLGHKWANEAYAYEWDAFTSCTAKRKCLNDERHEDSMTVDVITETKSPTCTEDGLITYTAAFFPNNDEGWAKTQQKTAVVDKIGHDYSVRYDWNEAKTQCTAYGVCKNDETHTITVQSNPTKITLESAPSCMLGGVERHTVTFPSGYEKWIQSPYSTTVPLAPLGHKEMIIPKVEPTCTATGLTEGLECASCGEVLKAQEIIPANGHTYGEVTLEWNGYESCTAYRACQVSGCLHVDFAESTRVQSQQTVEQTCAQDGIIVHTAFFAVDWVPIVVKEEILPATGEHTFGTWTTTIAPTCTVNGMQATNCKVCGELLHREVAATGHNYQATITAPTCEEQGYTTHVCSRCSDSYKDTYKDATGHQIVDDPAILATCTTSGKTAGTHCRVCNKVFIHQSLIPATGHSWIDATCIAPKTCATCGTTEGEIGTIHPWQATQYQWSGYASCEATRRCANSTSHKETATTTNITSAITTQPTCTTKGVKIYTATFTGNGAWAGTSTATEDIAAVGHKWGGWSIATKPTCTMVGTNRRECSVCDAFETQTIAANGHTWIAATCTAPKTCKVCGITSGEALGHNEVFDPAVPATCTTAGKTAGSHCSRCSKTFTPQQTVPALGHTWASATCTTPKTCSVCGTTEGVSLGHQWSAATYSWSDDKSTCTATRTCINNSAHTQTAKANVTSNVTTQPTCGTAGVRTYYADFEATWCASQQTTGTIPATGEHTWGTITITRQPTCTTTGTKTSNCIVCNAPLFEVIPATGNHTPGNWEITLEPTTTSTGTRVKKCTQCQQVQQTETIPKIAEYNLTITINKTAYTQPGSGATTVGNVASISGTVASKIKSNETLTCKLIPTTTKTGKMKLTASIVAGNATCTLVADDTSRNSYTLTIKDATADLTISISGSTP